MATRADVAVSGSADYSIWRVILASALGTHGTKICDEVGGMK